MKMITLVKKKLMHVSRQQSLNNDHCEYYIGLKQCNAEDSQSPARNPRTKDSLCPVTSQPLQ